MAVLGVKLDLMYQFIGRGKKTTEVSIAHATRTYAFAPTYGRTYPPPPPKKKLDIDIKIKGDEEEMKEKRMKRNEKEEVREKKIV